MEATIPKFFSNREILVTGGTGFIGKALIEKLLRSCPDLKVIYMLIRVKKGQSPEQRLDAVCQSVLFDLLRQKNPNFKSKLIPIAADVAKIDVGLSDDDKSRLKDVSVVFHSAADTRFDNSLLNAVFMNSRGAFELLKLCESFRDLKAFLHISTGYSNSHVKHIQEKIYEPLADWMEVIKICEESDLNDVLDVVADKFIGLAGNTYTFSKQLAEQIVKDFSEKMPIAIVRPTVVFNVIKEPLPGYMEKLNALSAMSLGIGTGMVKALHCDPKTIIDGIPVDVAVKGIIVAAWKRAVIDDNSLAVYNAAFTSTKHKVSIRQTVEMATSSILKKIPFGDNVVLPPSIYFGSSKKLVFFHSLFSQVFPALIVDLALKMIGRKPRVLKVQRKIFDFSKPSSSFFMVNRWTFDSGNFDSLNHCLKLQDLEDFDFSKYEFFSFEKMLTISIYGIRKFMLNLRDEDLPKDQLKYKILGIAFKILKVFVAVMLVKLMIFKFKGF